MRRIRRHWNYSHPKEVNPGGQLISSLTRINSHEKRSS